MHYSYCQFRRSLLTAVPRASVRAMRVAWREDVRRSWIVRPLFDAGRG